jgi:glycosyltransferase involved in cell wall biosynthesis
VILNPLQDDLPVPNFEHRTKTVVNFCRLHSQKNLSLLIRAFKLFHAEHDDYQLVIYGDGEERDALNALISELELNGCVEMRPFSPTVLKSISTAEIFVSSSNYEGLSNSVIEAMALGLPCVVTDCPIYGARMIIDSYKNGILVPVKDERRMANALSFFADNPERADQIGRRAADVRQLLNPSAICKEWQAVIDACQEDLIV